MMWTHDMATRRMALVRREMQGAITADQRAELDALTEALNEYAALRAEAALARLDGLPGFPTSLLAVSSLDVPGARLPACRECGAFDPCEHDRGEVESCER